MARLGCGGGGDGAHRSTRSCIKFHGEDGARKEEEEEAGIVPRGLDTKFHGADGARVVEKEEEAGIVPRGLDIKFHGTDGTGGRMGG